MRIYRQWQRNTQEQEEGGGEGGVGGRVGGGGQGEKGRGEGGECCGVSQVLKAAKNTTLFVIRAFSGVVECCDWLVH